MIKNIEVINNRNEHTVIELSNPRPTGFLITNIDGLDAPKGTINMIERTMLDGSMYNGSRANSRNIVMNLRYFWGNLNNDSIEAVRHKSYRMCPIGEKIQLIVHTDLRDVYFNGYVESNEVNIFDKFESSQISIMCEDAYGRGQNNNTEGFTGVTAGFEFPFSNESLEEPLIEFGQVYVLTTKRIDCKSEARTGFNLRIKFADIISGVTVTNRTTNQTMKVNGMFLEDDVLEISTIAGHKGVTKNGVNIIGDFYTNSSNDWVELLSGANVISIRDGTGEDVLGGSQMDIEYPLLYMGV